jgi:hypothetical protein
MFLSVAGRERTQELGGELAARAGRRPPLKCPPLAPEHSALSLGAARNRRDYLERFAVLIRIRQGLKTDSFDIPAPAGWRGGLLRAARTVLWRLLRYQHDRMAGQQNTINEFLIYAWELERQQVRQELAALTERCERLEAETRRLKTEIPPAVEAQDE